MLVDKRDHKREERDDGIVRRSFGVAVKSIDKENRCVDVVASTAALDAADEIVDQSWDLSRYEKNPVVLYNHNRGASYWGDGPSQEESLPIGYSKKAGIVAGELHATLCFVDEKASPLAEKCWQGFVQGSLRAVSVGFRPRDVHDEIVDGREITRLSNNELFEISVTPLPANPEAVMRNIEQLARLKALHVKKTPAPGADNKAAPSGSETPTMALTAEEEKSLRDTVTTLQTQVSVHKELGATQEKSLEVARTELTAVKSALETEKTNHATTSKALESTKASLDVAVDRVAELEVDALIGVKLTPAEKPVMLKLAKKDKSLFDEQMSLRPTLTILKGAMPPAGTETVPPTGSNQTGAPALDGKSTDAGEPNAGHDLANAIFAPPTT